MHSRGRIRRQTRAKRRGHGEGGIYQRESDGKWCASVDLGFVNGKRRRKVIYGKTRKEVADKLKAIHRDQAAGINVATGRQTVKAFLERWLEVSKQRNKTRTYEGYERIVALYLVPHLGHIVLGKLAPEHVQMMIDRLALAPNTVRNIRAVLRRALNQALKWKLVSRNVATLVETPRITQEEMSALDQQQARVLLRVLKGDRLEALYRVALSLGLRRGEVLGLRWQDIDLDTATLRIAQTVQRTRTQGLIIDTPKTKSSLRTLSIPPVLLAVLKRHRSRQEGEGIDNPHDLVFISTTGTPLEPDNITHRFKAFAKAAELPDDIHFHSLRHSCATLLLAQSVPMYVVKDILGHDQISTTMKYTHPTPETMRDATAELDLLFPEDEKEDQQEEE
jgi:integrase